MKFVVEIKLGNGAMRLGEDVADALEKVASKLRHDYGNHDLYCFIYSDLADGRPIYDDNGNSVGSYKQVEQQ